jgi:hypothetical protein
VNLGRSLGLGAAGLAVTATLAACGFDYPTDRINNVAEGADYRDGTVDILNAVVVAQQANSGTFVATFVNNSPTKTISLQSASGDNTAISSVDAPSFSLRPNTLVNLAQKKGIPVSGTFSLGQFVPISFTFDDGETADLQVPVVSDQGQWAGLYVAPPSATASSSDTASPSATASPSDTASSDTSPSDTSSSGSASPSG